MGHPRRGRDLYMVDLIKLAIDEIGLRLIDEFCWIRSRVAPVRLGPRRLPDGWMRCLHFSASSPPDTYPEQVESRRKRQGCDGLAGQRPDHAAAARVSPRSRSSLMRNRSGPV